LWPRQKLDQTTNTAQDVKMSLQFRHSDTPDFKNALKGFSTISQLFFTSVDVIYLLQQAPVLVWILCGFCSLEKYLVIGASLLVFTKPSPYLSLWPLQNITCSNVIFLQVWICKEVHWFLETKFMSFFFFKKR
jgi:hypothetical protein